MCCQEILHVYTAIGIFWNNIQITSNKIVIIPMVNENQNLQKIKNGLPIYFVEAINKVSKFIQFSLGPVWVQ